MLPLLFKQHIVCSNSTQRMKVRVRFFYMSVVLRKKNGLQNGRNQLKILTKSLSPEVQIPGYEADHSSQFSAKVNGWRYTAISQSFSWLGRGGWNLPTLYVLYLQQEGHSITLSVGQQSAIRPTILAPLHSGTFASLLPTVDIQNIPDRLTRFP